MSWGLWELLIKEQKDLQFVKDICAAESLKMRGAMQAKQK